MSGLLEDNWAIPDTLSQRLSAYRQPSPFQFDYQGGRFVATREFPPIATFGYSTTSFRAEKTLADSIKDGILTEAEGVSSKFAARIQQLYDLPVGWDGERASAVHRGVLARAVYLVKRLKVRALTPFVEPFVSPTYAGFVQLDWSGRCRSLEAEINIKGASIVGTEVNRQGQHYFEADISGDFIDFQRFYSWFCMDELLWPNLSR